MKLLFHIYILVLGTLAMAKDKDVYSLLHDGNNKISARMFTEVANENPEKSFVLSAFSVMTPLAQLGLASVEDTRDEILNAIGMPDDVTTKEVFSEMNKRLRSKKEITLKTANKIYVAQKYTLNEEFSADTRDSFESEVQNINFLDKENAVTEINTWVAGQTNNRIKDLVDQNILTTDLKVLLVNAIYFKGLWQTQFETDLTRDHQFRINRNKTTTVSMMHRRGRYKFVNSLKLKSKILEIPYRGDESSLIIVLPKDIEGINEVANILEDPNALDIALKEMHYREIEIHVPRFKIETTTDLKKVLTKMNIQKMFNADTAKLYRLVKDTQNLYVDSATQKVVIEVNEGGTEADAANKFSIYLMSRVRYFAADHPFLFFLREGDNTLFSGAYYGN